METYVFQLLVVVINEEIKVTGTLGSGVPKSLCLCLLLNCAPLICKSVDIVKVQV